MAKKRSLRDLGFEMPTKEEIEQIFHGVEDIDPRAAALVLTSMLANQLEMTIRVNLVEQSEANFASLFRSPTAALSSFSAKIAMAHALGVIGDETRRQLDRLRVVRNAFAHTVRPIDFDTEQVARECNLLSPASLLDESVAYEAERNTPRERFQVVATLVAIHLHRYTKAKFAEIRERGLRQPWPDRYLHQPGLDDSLQ